MALGMLFIILTVALLIVAWASWRGGLLIASIGALVLAGWLASMAASALRRRR